MLRLDSHLLEIFLSKFRYQQLWLTQGLAQWPYTVVREEQDLGWFSLQDLHWDKEGWEMYFRLLPGRSNPFPG